MSNTTEQRPPLIRFLDAFLQEQNIKWLLGVGVCILLGSSLRLVTMHWNECTPVWKYLILLGYSGIVFPLSEFSYHRLGLRKTGTVLMALTVLLIPLSFFALHWVRPQETASLTDLLRNSMLSVLLGVNLVWSSFAAHRMFRHFFRQTQPTFLLCYLALCVAGAVVPGLPTTWTPALTLGLYAVFAIGATKVNRHIFWLTEEHRLPRIFGFFPILLLGSQFVAVLAFGMASHLSLAWIGLLCALVALPVLLTADAVAKVFEQRTGGLVKPIPWSISGPLILGTILCVAGPIMALTQWPGSSIAVPTVAIAAVAFGIVANRTQKSAFAWAMVICTIIAYQTCPVFFKELVLQIRDQAAAAVRESRLPYAFYGLTYAPLIASFSLLASQLKRRGQTLFAQPIQLTALVLPWILFGVSFSHPTAVFPVACVSCVIFAFQTILFRQRLLLAPVAIAFLAAAYGLPAFCDRVLLYSMSNEEAILVWITAAASLMAPGFLVDRWNRSLKGPAVSPETWDFTQNICQQFSLAASLIASLIWNQHLWTSTVNPSQLAAGLVSLAIVLLLVAHSLRWILPHVSQWTLVFSMFAALCHLPIEFRHWETELIISSSMLWALWLMSYLLERTPSSRVSRAFGRPMMQVSLWGMRVLFVLFTANWISFHLIPTYSCWTAGCLVLAFALDATRRLRSPGSATIVWCSLPIFCSAVATSILGTAVVAPWWMAIWAGVGFGLLAWNRVVSRRMHRTAIADDTITADGFTFRQSVRVWLSPLNVIVPVLFFSVAVAQLWYLDAPHRAAGLIALAGMFACRKDRSWHNLFAFFFPLLNWTLLSLVATDFVAPGKSLVGLTFAELQIFALPLAAFAAISVLIFEWSRLRNLIENADLVIEHQTALMSLTLAMLGIALTRTFAAPFEVSALCWAATSWLSIVASQISTSVRAQSRPRVWWALATLLCGFLYLAYAGAWPLTEPAVMYAVLLIGLAFWSIGHATQNSSRFGVLSNPTMQTGFWLPLTVVPLALFRHFEGGAATWAGANSLPLLGAAAFYFWQGIQRRQLPIAVLSAVILNLATCLTLNELHWTDPQLFLIPIGISILLLTEIMQAEIPKQHHKQLWLTGALLILVSPTFEIVHGSWQHILTLMIACVFIGLIAIGLRIRILLHTSTAFLIADLVALVVRGSYDQPNVLWIVGVAVGTSVIALGAICENHRETVLGRLRVMAARLEQWR